MSELHRVEVTFEGEQIATHIKGETTYRLYRVDEEDGGGFFFHWQDEQGAWLETGQNGGGVPLWTVRALFPALEFEVAGLK